ncbi:site-specific integrase [Ruminococcus sp. FC2018]|uniref:tyrosine-type recombinase/integrase n=1 Tax=Ruminococcus sp. FC2018 TaxID=1410617 RepID=UPI00048D2D9B|nr:site-specific integrase [Ruminococcus sp. FC2018]
MSRRGDNIHKRSDGRWEGRYISGRNELDKAVYKSVYAHSYAECSEKLKLARCDLLPVSKPITIDELFAAWHLSRKNKVKQSTFVNYLTLYNNYLRERFGTLKVENLNSFMLNRFIDDMLTNGGKKGLGLSPTTMQSIMILLRSVLEYGELEYGLSNAAKHISLPKAQNNTISVFSKFEICRIRNCADLCNSIELGIVLTLFTGLRIGELCALTWEDIDIAEQLIHVRKTLFRIANQGDSAQKTAIVIDTPKSKSSLRDVPIPSFLLGEIVMLKQCCSDDDFILTCSPRPTEPRTYTLRFKSFLKRIGVPYRNFHALRHTFAKQCVKSGVDVKTLSELLGHSSVKITLDRYIRRFREAYLVLIYYTNPAAAVVLYVNSG